MKKNYYIGILDAFVKDDTIKFVYEIDRENKVAKWATYQEIRAKGKKPLKFKTKKQAENLQFGLCMNLTWAVIVTTNVDMI
jgi:hypothetical protein